MSFLNVNVQVSSVLLGSAELLYDQLKQNALSLWGPNADMSEEAGSRPKRIAFLICALFPAAVYFMYAYIYGVVGLTVATVEGEKSAEPNEKQSLVDEKSPAEHEDAVDESAEVSTTSDIEAGTNDKSSTGSKQSNLFPMPAGMFPQARQSVCKIMQENQIAPGKRHAVVYLLLNILLSRLLSASIGTENAFKQWAIHLTTSVLLSGVRMQWTHAIVTDCAYPTPYFPTLKLAEHHALLLPTLAYASAQPIVFIATAFVSKSLLALFEAHNANDIGWPLMLTFVVGLLLAGFVVAAALVVGLAAPTLMVLNRVEVAMLDRGLPTRVTMYTEDRREVETGFVAPLVCAWRSVDGRGLKNMSWLCFVVAWWVAIPASQFLQIGAQSQPGA